MIKQLKLFSIGFHQVILSLEEYNFGDRRYQVAVLAVELAMDHKPSSREMTSILLSDLYERFLGERDIQKGDTETTTDVT